MKNTRIERDEHLIAAGECFMSLCWVESTMGDLIVLQDGDDDMRKRYNDAFGHENHPADFTRNRLNLGKLTFEKVKEKFLYRWPDFRKSKTVHKSIERAVIFRNGFSHANIQPFRPYLLYTPDKSACKKIKKYTKCPKCLNYREICKCQDDNLSDPRTLIFRCLEKEFLTSFYGDIQRIDLECFVHAAKSIDVAYRGWAWPRDNEYVIGRSHPSTPK